MANCTAIQCTKCIQQADHCEWDNSDGLCYSWFDDPHRNGVKWTAGCTSVIVPIILAVVLLVCLCIAAQRWHQRKHKQNFQNNALSAPMMGNGPNNFNPPQIYQPAGPVLNYGQPTSPQQYLHMPPPQQAAGIYQPAISNTQIQPNVAYNNPYQHGGYMHQ